MHGYTVGPFSIEATEAVAMDIILKFILQKIFPLEDIFWRKQI